MKPFALATLVFVLTAALARPAAGAEAAESSPARPAPGKLTGTVRDAAGKPAAGLRLLVVPEWAANIGEVRTDANGRFKMDWSPQRLGGMNASLCLVVRDPARNLAAVQEVEEGATSLDLRLEPGLIVAGRLEDASGHPLTNGTVSLQLWVGNMTGQIEREPVKTDARGRFEIPALAPQRRYWLFATAPGYGSTSMAVQNEEAETNRLELAPFALNLADRQIAGVVVDTDEKPVAGVYVNLTGNGQPNASTQTDEKGRFQFAACEGQAMLFANSFTNGQNRFAQARAEGGDTNVVVTLDSRQTLGRPAVQRPSLKGKPLPDLAAVGLDGKAPAGKPILLCLFDMEQRPSRRCLRLLGEQRGRLAQKGITVLGLQTAPATDTAWKDWLAASAVPFPLGRLPEKTGNLKWAADVESLPWLILANAQGKVTAEGFALEELDAQLKVLGE